MLKKYYNYRLSKCAPIIAATGLSFLDIGSGSTLNPSIAIAPRRYNEFFGPNITSEGKVSAGSVKVNNAEPSKLRMCLPSANITSLVCNGVIPIFSNRSSGTKVYREPVSTQKSSSKNNSGLEGLDTFTCTLNIPITVSHFENFYKNNVTKKLSKINEGKIINSQFSANSLFAEYSTSAGKLIVEF